MRLVQISYFAALVGVGLTLLSGRADAANLPPTVQLTSPLHGAYAVAPATVSFHARATDADGTIAKVEFYQGTNKLAEVTNAPFAFAWTNVGAGNYDLTAVSTDNGGLTATSMVHSISILTNGASIRVMPLGDSITAGSGYDTNVSYPGAYRVRLWQDITNAGLSVNFVGSLSNGPAALGDFDHEGHPGFFIGPGDPLFQGALSLNVDAWLSNSLPQVVLLMAGANDAIVDYDFTNAAARLGALMDQILTNATATNIHLVVSSLTPLSDSDSQIINASLKFNRIQFLNAAIPAMVESRRAAGKRISFVDNAKAVTRFDLVDGTHPDTNSHHRLGNFWFGALRPLLTCEAPPLVQMMSPTNGFRFVAPSNLVLNVTVTNLGASLQRVEFFQDSVKLGERTNAPYTLTVTNVTSGSYEFCARAVQSNGAAAFTGATGVQDEWVFVRGVNINGSAGVNIEGNNWLSWADATNQGFSIPSNAVFNTQAYPSNLTPTIYDPNLQAMFQSLVYASDASQPLTMRQTVTNGYYRVYLWALEDFADYARSFTIRVEGVTVATNVMSVPKYQWEKLGPYPAIVTDGQLDIETQRDINGAPAIFGVGIFRLDVTNQPPVITSVGNQTINKNTSLGPIPILLGDDYTATSNLLIAFTSTNTALVPTNNLVLGGSGTNRTLTVTPSTNQFGVTLITVSATDDLGLSTNMSFTLTVSNVNTAPVATPQGLTTGEETPLNLTLAGTDAETNTLTFTIGTPPAHGSLSGLNTNSGAVTYTPATNYFGPDSFTFLAHDGLTSSAPAIISLTITNINDPPVATNQTRTVVEDTATLVTMNVVDGDSSNFVFTIVATPTNGTLGSLNATNGTVTYTPATNFNGADSFTFFVSDGALTTSVATVSLTVNAVNDAPVAVPQNVFVGSASNLVIALTATDVDSSNLTFAIVGSPTNGSLSGFNPTSGAVTYSPASNFTGLDQFTFQVTDGSLTSAVATVTIATNHAPTSVRLVNPINGAFAVAPASVTFLATASDPDGNLARVDFYQGTNLVGTATNTPYAFIWTNVSAAQYSLTARAVDALESSVTSSVAHITVLTNGASIRVMPLGDSITAGAGYANSYPGAYRVQLWSNFTAAGLSVNFVGSSSNGPVELGDLDHNGQGGAVIGPSTNVNNLHTNLDAWLAANPPDLVLLMAGVNDILGVTDLSNAPARLGNLVDKILTNANATNAHVLVSTVTPLFNTTVNEVDWDTRARAFNGQLPGVISNRVAAGRRVSLVDGFKSIGRYELQDGVHPNTNAYHKFGNTWYGGLFPLLTCKAAPLVTLDLPPAGLVFTAPTNLVLTASATDADGTVVRVEFYKNDELVATVTNAPYTFTVTNLTSGRYTFTARAVDNDGAAASTEPASVRDQLPFVLGVNLNGPAVSIDGYDWLSQAEAVSNGLTIASNFISFDNGISYIYSSPSFIISPPADAATDLAARSFFYSFSGDGEGWTLSQTIGNGTYQVYVWTVEQYSSFDRSIDLRIEGVPVATNIGSLPLGEWRKYGPFPATVADGALSMEILRHNSGTPSVFAFAIFGTASNTAPVANSQSVGLLEDNPAAITLTGTDAQSNALTFTVVSGPTNGALSGFNTNTGTLTYTPGTNYFGSDSFTFSVKDGALTSAVATVSLTMTNVNDAPLASNQSVTLPEDTATALTLAGFDVEGSNLTFTVVSGPANGALSGFNTNTGALTYTPGTNFFGSDSFTFSVKDGALTSAVATVSLTITNVNDLPLASNQSVTLPEDIATLLTLTGFDVEGSNLTFIVVSGPTNGVLSGFSTNTGTLTYTPGTNFFGADSFTYRVSDGSLTSAVATVSLTITNVNDAPLASNQSVTLPEDVATALTLTGFDVEGSNLTFTVVSGPTNGALSGFNTNTGTLTYTPGTNFFGSDNFTFSVKDGALTSAIATVSLTITNVNDAPVAGNLAFSLPADTNSSQILPGSDLDGDTLTFAAASLPTNGLLSGFNATNGAFIYTPAHAFTGGDAFTYTVTDGALSRTGQVSLTVLPLTDTDGDGIPDAWELANALNPAVNDAHQDPDGDGQTNLREYRADTRARDAWSVLRLAEVRPTTNGQFVVSWDAVGGVRYRVSFSDGGAGGGYNGSFTNLTRPVTAEMSPAALGAATNMTFTDDFTLTGPPAVPGIRYYRITVVSPPILNTPPLASNQSVTLGEDTATNLVLQGFDPEGSSLTYTVVGGPANGAISGFNPGTGALTYTPGTNFFGADSFTYRVSDGSLTSAVATVSLTITNVNDAPLASNQSVTLPEDVATALTLTGFDVEGSNLTFTVVSGPTNGALSGFNTNTGTLTYTPGTNFFGSDSFTFSVKDGALTSVVATVSLTITNVNDAPLASNQSVTLPEDTATLLTLAGFDLEGSNLTFTVVSGPINGVISGFNTNTGALIYTAASNYSGSDSFTFSVRDGSLTSAVATASLLVTNADNDPPVAFSQTVLVAQGGTPATFKALGTPGAALAAVADSAAQASASQAVAGFFRNAAGNFEAFRWTASNGLTGLGDLAGGIFESSAAALSGDGLVVAGTGNSGDSEAFRWTAGGGLTGLGFLPGGSRSGAAAANSNGAVLAGWSTATGSGIYGQAFRWTSGGGLSGLGYLAGGTNSGALALSADGGVVAGWSDAGGFITQAFRWTSGGGMVGLGDLPGGLAWSEARGVSGDGQVIVGYGASVSGQEAFRWSSGSGMTGLGDLPGGLFASVAHGVSFDGSVVVGAADTEAGTEAFYWSAATGMVNLRELLAGLGATNLAGWMLQEALAVSADGRTIAGVGVNPAGGREAWVATVPGAADLSLPREDVPVSITLTGFDVEGSNLTFTVVSGPTNGALSGFNTNTGTLTYTPNTNFFGVDSFTFSVKDGQLTSAVATVSLTITNVNDAPFASNQSVTLPEDVATVLTLAGFDVEGSNLTYTVVSGPANGAISGFNTNTGALTYTPGTNFFGSDSFTFSVKDGSLTSAVATVSLTITNVNDAPLASNQSVTLPEDVATALTLTGFDVEGSNLTFTVVSGPTNGVISGFNTNTGSLTYTPNTNFFGLDSFTFSVKDGSLTSAVATVTFTITNVNDAPVASNQSVTLPEDVATALTLTGVDVEGSNLTFTVLSGPTNGVLSGFNTNSGALTYTPTTNFFGLDSFTFGVKDGSLTSAVATVILTITNVNDAPVASNVYFTVIQNTNATLSFPTNDLDGDPVAYTVLAMPTNGLISIFNPTNSTFTYAPVHAFIGNDSFDYTVSDGLFTRTGQVSITVQALPDADGDGIPDLWELAHGLNTATNDAALDADGDGKSNLKEYFANTSAQDSRSFIQITSAQALPNGHFLVTWDAVGGVRYRVQFSNGDIGGGYTGSFVSVPRSIINEVGPGSLGTPTTMTFTDDLTLTGPTAVPGIRYFRVEAIR